MKVEIGQKKWKLWKESESGNLTRNESKSVKKTKKMRVEIWQRKWKWETDKESKNENLSKKVKVEIITLWNKRMFSQKCRNEHGHGE